MPSALRIILTAEEDLTLKELSCADKVPRRTKQRAIALRLEQNRRYSARQLSQKLFEERQIELGAEQIRRLLKKRGGVGNVCATVQL